MLATFFHLKENDGTIVAALLHHISHDPGRQPGGKHSEDSHGFGDDAMGITQIKEWYNRFKGGRTSVESEPRSDRPSTCRNDQVIAK